MFILKWSCFKFAALEIQIFLVVMFFFSSVSWLLFTESNLYGFSKLNFYSTSNNIVAIVLSFYIGVKASLWLKGNICNQ